MPSHGQRHRPGSAFRKDKVQLARGGSDGHADARGRPTHQNGGAERAHHLIGDLVAQRQRVHMAHVFMQQVTRPSMIRSVRLVTTSLGLTHGEKVSGVHVGAFQQRDVAIDKRTIGVLVMALINFRQHIIRDINDGVRGAGRTGTAFYHKACFPINDHRGFRWPRDEEGRQARVRRVTLLPHSAHQPLNT